MKQKVFLNNTDQPVYWHGRLIKKGEEIIIMSFILDDGPIKARNILVDGKNRFVRYL